MEPLSLRESEVRRLYHMGLTGARIAVVARSRGVDDLTVRMVRYDLKKMGLPLWSRMTKKKLVGLVTAALTEGHGALGREGIYRYLSDAGYRVRRRDVVWAMKFLDVLRAPPRKMTRRAWYNGVGPCSSSTSTRTSTSVNLG
jgi:repressor of nif and glnA expression